MSPLKRFFLHYSHFFTGNALTLALGLISFPILTRILSTEEYGILGLVTSTMMLLVALAKAGLSEGIIRFYKEYSDTPERSALFSSTVILRGLVLSAGVVVLYLAIFPPTATYLDIEGRYRSAFLVMALYLFVRPMNIIVLNMLRVTDKTFFFSAINFAAKLASIALSLLIFLALLHELYGYFIGIVVAEIGMAVVLFRWYLAKHRVSPRNASWELAGRLIRFGAPLLITELAYVLLTYVDRYMIVYYHDEAALGLYSVGYNLASYIGDLIMFSLSYAVIPIYVGIYQSEGKVATERFLARCLNYLLIAVIPICAGYFAVSEDLLITLASEKYAPAAALSPLILLASSFLTVNYILNAGLYLQKKSVVLLLIMVATVTVDVIANVILLPHYGIEGAAIAKLVAAACSTALTVTLSYRYLFVRVDFRTVVYYAALSVSMYFVVGAIDLPYVWLSLMAKVATGVAILIPGILLREKDLRTKIFQRLRKLRRRTQLGAST